MNINSINQSQESIKSSVSNTSIPNSVSTVASQGSQQSRASKFHEDTSDWSTSDDPKVFSAGLPATPAPAATKLRLPEVSTVKPGAQNAGAWALSFLKKSFGYIGLGVAIVVLTLPLVVAIVYTQAVQGFTMLYQAGADYAVPAPKVDKSDVKER